MLVVALAVGPAHAHITMDRPNPVTASQKEGPCGDGPHVRGTDVKVYAPGETITVKWHETIDHPSHYRISFDDDGDDSFADPATTDDFYTNDTVLLDEIPDEADGEFEVEVTLPDIECETCTLQLVQLMLDKPPYEPGTNDLYYQCADVALRSEAATGGTPDPTADTAAPAAPAGRGCGCDGAGGPAPLLVGPALVLVARRRRRLPR